MNMMGEGFRNRRRAPRASVVLPASVVTMNAYQYLEVLNLSPTGAKLRGSPRPEIGKTAMFRLEGFQLLCKVVWAKDDQCGVPVRRAHSAARPGRTPRGREHRQARPAHAGRAAGGRGMERGDLLRRLRVRSAAITTDARRPSPAPGTRLRRRGLRLFTRQEPHRIAIGTDARSIYHRRDRGAHGAAPRGLRRTGRR